MKKNTDERLEGVERWQEKMDMCLHTARILMGILWALTVAVFTAISAHWDTIWAYLTGAKQ